MDDSRRSSNISLHDPSNTSAHSLPCFFSARASYIFSAFTATNTLFLLPLSGAVLLMGFRRRRKRRAGVASNPADVFAYHMAVMELLGICGSALMCYGSVLHRWEAWNVGFKIFPIVSCVKMGFHILTCLERYLAISRPVAYLGLSKTGGVGIRNLSTGCVWLICTAVMTLRFLLSSNINMIVFFSYVCFSLAVISFCGASVLCVLIGPGPGEGRGHKADRSKRRAFVTIAVIQAVLLLRFVGNLVCFTLANTSLSHREDACLVQMSGMFFCLPTSYVLPVMFLHRAGKLPCCGHK